MKPTTKYVELDVHQASKAGAPGTRPDDEQVIRQHQLHFPEDAVPFRPDALDEGKAVHAERIRTFRRDLYDTREFIAGCGDLGATPHAEQYTNARSSAVDGRTARHDGYAESQRKRKKVEENFG